MVVSIEILSKASNPMSTGIMVEKSRTCDFSRGLFVDSVFDCFSSNPPSDQIDHKEGKENKEEDFGNVD